MATVILLNNLIRNKIEHFKPTKYNTEITHSQNQRQTI